MSEVERAHADLLRQDRLDRLVQITTELAERERTEPGSVHDLAVHALHSSVTSWARLLDLGVRP